MVVFDYDKRKRQAIIKTEDLGIIREHFSLKMKVLDLPEGMVDICQQGLTL